MLFKNWRHSTFSIIIYYHHCTGDIDFTNLKKSENCEILNTVTLLPNLVSANKKLIEVNKFESSCKHVNATGNTYLNVLIKKTRFCYIFTTLLSKTCLRIYENR